MSNDVRLTDETAQTLRRLSAITGRTMSGLAGEAIKDLRKRFILEATNNGYRALAQDEEAWKEEQEQRKAWDNAVLADVW